MPELTPYHIKIAAEAFAAGLLAHACYDVSIQYGANQPNYDLIVGKGEKLAKISVKGTQLNGWTLAGNFVRDANYHRAADEWLEKQGKDLIFFLVSFVGKQPGELPDCFIAKAFEIARHLKTQRGGVGHGSLALNHVRIRGQGAGTTDATPLSWKFSPERMDKLVDVSSVLAPNL